MYEIVDHFQNITPHNFKTSGYLRIKQFTIMVTTVELFEKLKLSVPQQKYHFVGFGELKSLVAGQQVFLYPTGKALNISGKLLPLTKPVQAMVATAIKAGNSNKVVLANLMNFQVAEVATGDGTKFLALAKPSVALSPAETFNGDDLLKDIPTGMAFWNAIAAV